MIPTGASRLLLALVLAAGATGCKSSAPYTIPAAAINSALAVGVSAAQRSAGGCYAQCVGGTICNPRTGFCESPAVVCVGAEADSLACLNRPGATMNTGTQVPGASPALPGPLGISPATGTVPPPPGSRP
ncbi:MAG: hypothetical protein WB493_14060 [Anaeromyxobacteraceae bacterium]